MALDMVHARLKSSTCREEKKRFIQIERISINVNSNFGPFVNKKTTENMPINCKNMHDKKGLKTGKRTFLDFEESH